jgi:hypothetical protein
MLYFTAKGHTISYGTTILSRNVTHREIIYHLVERVVNGDWGGSSLWSQQPSQKGHRWYCIKPETKTLRVNFDISVNKITL